VVPLVPENAGMKGSHARPLPHTSQVGSGKRPQRASWTGARASLITVNFPGDARRKTGLQNGKLTTVNTFGFGVNAGPSVA